MSTILVRNFPSIQAAINASGPADVLDFAGIQRQDTFTPASNRTYLGNGATLSELNGRPTFNCAPNIADISVSGFTAVGRFFYAATNGVIRPQRIEIVQNKFGGAVTPGSNPGAIFLVNVLNYLIGHNASTYSSPGGGFAEVFGGRGAVVNNYIDGINGGEGTHYVGNVANHELFIFAGNYGHCGRMFLEAQNAGDDIRIWDNWVGDGYAEATQRDTYFGLSVATDLARKISILRNYINAPTRTDGIGMRIGIEHGADPSVYGAAEIAFNAIVGINAGITLNTSWGTSCHDNLLVNDLQPTQVAGAAKAPRLSNNGASVVLPFDIHRAFPLPLYAGVKLADVISGNIGVGSGVTPPPTPPPVVIPPPVIVVPPTPADAPDGTIGTFTAWGHTYSVSNHRVAIDGHEDPATGNVIAVAKIANRLLQIQPGAIYAGVAKPMLVGSQYKALA